MGLGYDSYQAPFGCIWVIMDQDGLKRIAITPEQWTQCLAEYEAINRDETGCSPAIRQLDQYFSGKRREFDLSFSMPEGTEFSKKVWGGLLTIPFGETRSYTDIARVIGIPKGVRAVGQANRRNPLPIVIPCHRVIGKNGALTGYIGKGRLDIKEFLLQMERSYSGY
jgi:methylated-DNA-[protein]-cysteine S-methyltransferase